MIFSPDDIVKISDQVLSQEVSGETVLLDLASEKYFGLDTIGTRVWFMLEDGKSVADILVALLGEYDVERDQLEADVSELLEKLEQEGLVRQVSKSIE